MSPALPTVRTIPMKPFHPVLPRSIPNAYPGYADKKVPVLAIEYDEEMRSNLAVKIRLAIGEDSSAPYYKVNVKSLIEEAMEWPVNEVFRPLADKAVHIVADKLAVDYAMSMGISQSEQVVGESEAVRLVPVADYYYRDRRENEVHTFNATHEKLAEHERLCVLPAPFTASELQPAVLVDTKTGDVFFFIDPRTVSADPSKITKITRLTMEVKVVLSVTAAKKAPVKKAPAKNKAKEKSLIPTKITRNKNGGLNVELEDCIVSTTGKRATLKDLKVKPKAVVKKAAVKKAAVKKNAPKKVK